MFRVLTFGFVILVILSFLSLYKITQLAIETKREYLQVKETFREINSAVLDHSKAVNLLDEMEYYGYDSKKLKESLESQDSSVILSHLILAEQISLEPRKIMHSKQS